MFVDFKIIQEEIPRFARGESSTILRNMVVKTGRERYSRSSCKIYHVSHRIKEHGKIVGMAKMPGLTNSVIVDSTIQ